MRFLATLLITLLVLSAIILPQVLVVVDETELAIITRLGDPQRSIRSAGLYVKAPLVDSVTKFEKRLLIFDAPAESLLTSDKKRLIIDVYARGRVTDPLLFFQTVRSVTQARSRVIDIVASELRREIASDEQLEIIKTKREEIENAVRDAVRPLIEELGIDIVDVRIKRADFPQAIAGSVYERMKANGNASPTESGRRARRPTYKSGLRSTGRLSRSGRKRGKRPTSSGVRQRRRPSRSSPRRWSKTLSSTPSCVRWTPTPCSWATTRRWCCRRTRTCSSSCSRRCFRGEGRGRIVPAPRGFFCTLLPYPYTSSAMSTWF